MPFVEMRQAVRDTAWKLWALWAQKYRIPVALQGTVAGSGARTAQC